MCIHSLVFSNHFRSQNCGGSRAYSRSTWHDVGRHPEWDISLFQGNRAHTNTHSFTSRGTLAYFVYLLACSWEMERNPCGHGGITTEAATEVNQGPWSCEAAILLPTAQKD